MSIMKAHSEFNLGDECTDWAIFHLKSVEV